MPNVTIEQAMRLAMDHQRNGRLREAGEIYRQILAQQPECADAYHGMGVLQGQLGDTQKAIALFRKAIALYPAQVMYRLNLGKMLAQAGDIDGAIEAYQEALKLRPDFAEVHNNLGNLFKARGDLDEAMSCYRQALDYRPAFVEVYNNLSLLYRELGEMDEAIKVCGQALHHNPHFLIALNNMGNYLEEVGRIDEAVECYQQALWVRPTLAETRINLGRALQARGQMVQAIDSFKQVVKDDENDAQGWAHLGWAMMKAGRGEQGIECVRKAVALDPQNSAAHSRLVMLMQYREPPEAVRREAEAWAARHARVAAVERPGRDWDPERRLRVGLLGGELREDLLLPFVQGHHRERFEAVIFCDSARRDLPLERLKRAAGREAWRGTAGMSDGRLAQRIVREKIDILLELSGHVPHNRLGTLARRPAPLQVRYLGGSGEGGRGSTGMEQVDYVLTDPFADLEGGGAGGSGDAAYLEGLWRMAGCAWCFVEPGDAPEVGPAPSIEETEDAGGAAARRGGGGGRIRFGAFHAIAKISTEVVEAWAKLLEEVPGSRLLIKAPELGDAATWRQMETVLKESRIDIRRVEFEGWMQDRAAHLALYNEVDVALDVFPFHGLSSTFDALWMGVPVVTLRNGVAGQTGASLLEHAGLGELVAGSIDEYVAIAAGVARDGARLSALRAGLRNRLRASPLMNAAGHAKAVENALREMWRRRCAKIAPG